MASNILQSIRHIPKGIGRLYNDAKLMMSLRGQIKPPLTRKQREHIRITSASLRKAGLFILLQAPPIIGYLPVFIALCYPRQLLTHQFWTPAEHQQYLEEEFAERKEAAEQFLESNTHVSIKIPASLSDWVAELGKPVNITSVVSDPYAALSRIHYLYSVPALHGILPSSHLQTKLMAHSSQIISDDVDLHRENVQIEERLDLQLAALRRGINPTLPDAALHAQLKAWVEESNSLQESFGHARSEQDKRAHAMAVLCAIANNCRRKY
eukprot:gene36960-44838_t